MTTETPIIMPFEGKEILEELVNNFGLSLKEVAQYLGISLRTIYRIKEGKKVTPEILSKMILLCCELNTGILSTP